MIRAGNREAYGTAGGIAAQLERLQLVELENLRLTEALNEMVASADAVTAWAALPAQLQKTVDRTRKVRAAFGTKSTDSSYEVAQDA